MADSIFVPADWLPCIPSTITPEAKPGPFLAGRPLDATRNETQPQIPHANDDQERKYWRSYKRLPPYMDIDMAWYKHLHTSGFTHAFIPLKSTEKERYGDITRFFTKKRLLHEREARRIYWDMNKAAADLGRHRAAAFNRIEEAERRSLPAGAAPAHVAGPGAERRGRGRPRIHPRPGDVQAQPPGRPRDSPFEVRREHVQITFNRLARSIQDGIDVIDRYFASRKPCRLERQHPQSLRGNVHCRYGSIAVDGANLYEHWFMGHVPGDIIFRVVHSPNYALYALRDPNFASSHGSGDFNLNEDSVRFRYEGMVPFSPQERGARLAAHVYPAFVTMIIAALSFDLENPSAEVPPFFKEFEAMVRLWRKSGLKRAADDCGHLDVLKAMWEAKYGTQPSDLPAFLELQLDESWSRIGELCWLLYHLRGVPKLKDLFISCEWFVLAMTGWNVKSFAQRYFAHQLFPEAMRQVEERKLDDVFFYRSEMAEAQTLPALGEIYKQDRENENFPKEQLITLQQVLKLTTTRGFNTIYGIVDGGDSTGPHDNSGSGSGSGSACVCTSRAQES
ncbi:hypothetical protein F4779DRAFT_615400 [Xylariaceae sp. FL0662B]|nr:hypothetical protein F4779DRAFT_615400 [Xylariaceae sp. FL0662B]